MAVASLEGGWSGVFVGYDGGPEQLGRQLLDLVVERGGDIDAAWAVVAQAADGWRIAFREAYEPGINRAYFDTGRDDSSLRHDDAFVRNHAAYWYVFDRAARTLDVWENTQAPPRLYERVRFAEGGGFAFEIGSKDSLDWRNRRASYGDDDPDETAEICLTTLLERLPIVSKTVSVSGLPSARPILTQDGLVFPLVLYVAEPDATQEDGVRVSDIVEHDSYLILPRRVLPGRRRCELAIAAALDAIEANVVAETFLADASLGILEKLFPFDLLDLELDDATLQGAVRARVASCFQKPG